MAESWDIGIAKQFKSRDNKQQIGNIVGKVINAFPNIKISILDGNIILNKDQLYCCDHVLAGYTRQFQGQSEGTIITKTPPSPVTYDTYTVMESLDHTGQISFTDTLVVGDLVLLVHTEDEQTWFIIDKITKL